MARLFYAEMPHLKPAATDHHVAVGDEIIATYPGTEAGLREARAMVEDIKRTSQSDYLSQNIRVHPARKRA